MDKVGNTLNYVWVEDMNYPVKKNSNPNLPKWQEDTSRTKADAICCQKDVPAFRTFAGMHLDEDGDGFKDWDDTPSVEYNCYLSCMENYHNYDDGREFKPSSITINDNTWGDPEYFEKGYVSAGFNVEMTGYAKGRCYCRSITSTQCDEEGRMSAVGSNNYVDYDMPTVKFCTIKDGDVFFKTPYTDVQSQVECGDQDSIVSVEEIGRFAQY